MIGKPFVNDVLSHAIELYLKYKDKPDDPIFQSFIVVAIRTLVFIYGELDILNPYITQNEHNMGGFDNNLMKFGFAEDKLIDFKEQFLKFAQEEQKGSKPNVPFMKIEKYLIDMFCLKTMVLSVSDEEYSKFQNYLYYSGNQNPIMQQDMERFLLKKDEFVLYYQSKLFECRHQFGLEPIKRKTLFEEAYLLLGYSMEQVNNLTDRDLQNVNNQIFNFFRVDPNLNNKEELLVKAVNYYKRYGNRLTSGNGYVDFLLFAGIIATAIFLVVLYSLHYF